MNEASGTSYPFELGDARSADELLALIYNELRTLARKKISREKDGLTLQPTALVHEAWMRLNRQTTMDWQGRAHFFAAAAEAMRRILIEDARKKQRVKHGGELQRIEFDPAQMTATQTPAELLALHDALDKLSQEDRTKAELVQLRYFAGLTLGEAAEILGISRTTAARYWAYARAWLFDEINRGPASNRRD